MFSGLATKLLGSMLPVQLIAGAAILAGLWFWHAHAVSVSFKDGETSTQAKWDKEKLAQLEVAGKATLRAMENQTRASNDLEASEKVRLNEKRKAETASLAVGDELGKLRDELAKSSGGCSIGKDAPTSPRVDGTCRLERDLLRRCSTALAGMAKTADGLEQTVVGLQGYAVACHGLNQ